MKWQRWMILSPLISVLSPCLSLGHGDTEVSYVLASMGASQHRMTAHQQVLSADLVGAPVARPLSHDLIVRRILEIEGPRSAGEASLGTKIKKSGRSAGRTYGKITQVIVTAPVSCSFNRVAASTGQLMAGAMRAGGDSGSAVLDDDGV